MTIFTFVSCSSLSKQEKVKKEICDELQKSTGDKFWFIYGLDRDYSIATNIKYRGILYSDRLEKLEWPQGVEIALEDLSTNGIGYTYDNYKGLLMQIEIDGMAENRARKIFGEKVNLYNDGMTTEHMYKNIIKNKKRNISFDEKSGYYSTIVNVFVDDLDKLNNEEIKKKTYELAKFIYDDMNYVTALQVYVRDDKFFEDYNLVYGSIYKPFRDREDIKKILKKIKNKEKITEKEKVTLVRVFNKGGLDFGMSHWKFFLLSFNEKNETPISLENFMYQREKNKGEYLYFREVSTK